jgi:hypothetical protein
VLPPLETLFGFSNDEEADCHRRPTGCAGKESLQNVGRHHRTRRYLRRSCGETSSWRPVGP